MSELWQNLAIVFSVLGAVGYLIFRFVRWRHRRKACADCKLMQIAKAKKSRSSGDHATD